MDVAEFKSLLEKQGEAFEAFKATHEDLKKNDALTAEKLVKIEKSLDAAVEAKAAIDAAFAAEKKEREELEMRINRMGVRATGEEEAKRELALKEFNHTLSAFAADRKKVHTPFDQKGYDEYKATYGKWMREGKESLSPDEVKTLSVGSDSDGGVFVTPDTTGQIVKKIYETSPMRQHASVQVISTDKLEGIEDLDETSVGYSGEHSTSNSTDTPEVGKWSIPVWWIDCEPKATQQLLDDAMIDVEGWLGDKSADKLGRFENSEFVNGNSNKIRGVFAGYSFAADSGSGVTWGSFGYVATGVDGDFAASAKGDKLFDAMGLLKNAYLAGAGWYTRRSIITDIRKFKDSQNQYLWQPSFVLGVPETLVGHPVVRMEDVPAKATGSFSLAFGDMKQTYQIVDRQGIKVLRDPYTAKPYVKFFTTKRTGGGAVNFEAMKFLKFGTS